VRQRIVRERLGRLLPPAGPDLGNRAGHPYGDLLLGTATRVANTAGVRSNLGGLKVALIASSANKQRVTTFVSFAEGILVTRDSPAQIPARAIYEAS